MMSTRAAGSLGAGHFSCSLCFALPFSTRGILHNLLGHYLGIAPEQVCFSYSNYGKLCLAAPLNESGLESSRELAELSQIYEAEKVADFLRGWTRKEAFIKASGIDLSLDMKSFDVPLGRLDNLIPVQFKQKTNALAANLHSQRQTRKDIFHKQPNAWWLCPIDPIEGFVTALVVHRASSGSHGQLTLTNVVRKSIGARLGEVSLLMEAA